MTQRKPSLILCILLDTIGCLSFALPFLGELTDILWAPLSAVIFYFLFGRKKFGANGAVFSFIEELMPGLDFIPTFTLAWIVRKMQNKFKAVHVSKLQRGSSAF